MSDKRKPRAGGRRLMTTMEKRNALAVKSSMFIPVALDELKNAERFIVEGKLKEVSTCIAEAHRHLQFLREPFDEACAEYNAEQSVEK
jgi:hypothetical protein